MSLFSSPPKAPTGNLFGDDASGDPWSLPTPRTGPTRSGEVGTLLDGLDLPEIYSSIFDSASPSAGYISFTNFRKILENSGLSSSKLTKIVEIALPAQRDESNNHGISRGEFNVALALVALAQEGGDISLDAVDDRRRSLPLPTLKDTEPEVPAMTPARTTHREQLDRRSNAGTVPPSKNSPPLRPSTTSSTRAISSGRTSPVQVPALPSEQDVRQTPRINQQTSLDAVDPWGVISPSVPPMLSEGAPSHASRSWTTQDVDEIDVSVMPGKEGMFMFRHINYTLISKKKNVTVVRRYSDFVWLLDCLQRRYPFRQVPLLPPKRLAERRKKGLARFANALARHPVLSQEQLVIMFFSVPSELSVWKKQANLSVVEEFDGKELPTDLESSFPSDIEEIFGRVRAGVKSATDTYIGLCNLVDRLARRQEGISADLMRFSLALDTLPELNRSCYPYDQGDTARLNDGLMAVSKHLTTAQSIYEDGARRWDDGVLEDFKRQRDALAALKVNRKWGKNSNQQDLYDRRDRLGGDNIPQIERRIASHETKLSSLSSKVDAKVQDIEKVQNSIAKDKESIVRLKARRILIKACIRDELLHFQQSQWHIAKSYQEWTGELVKFAELHVENWKNLNNEVSEMPTEAQ